MDLHCFFLRQKLGLKLLPGQTDTRTNQGRENLGG